MFKYRQYGGYLSDSMRYVKEMENFAELERHITSIWEEVYGEGKVTVKPYGYDARIDWDTHMVCFNGHCVGYTDGPVERQEPDSTETAKHD